MPMSCSVSPISGTRSVEALFGHKTPHDKSKTESPINCYRELRLVRDSYWTMLGRFEVGDYYEYVGLSWVRKAAVWIQFNLQTRLQAFLELLRISRG